MSPAGHKMIGWLTQASTHPHQHCPILHRLFSASMPEPPSSVYWEKQKLQNRFCRSLLPVLVLQQWCLQLPQPPPISSLQPSSSSQDSSLPLSPQTYMGYFSSSPLSCPLPQHLLSPQHQLNSLRSLHHPMCNAKKETPNQNKAWDTQLK